MNAPARLLHVGPHKTGTTSIQDAFYGSRPRLLEHGVHYLGGTRDLRPVLLELLDHDRAGRTDGPESWQQLLAEADRTSAHTTVLSSELLCVAGDRLRGRLVADFVGDDGEVVITLRSLGAIMPSQWQQAVQAGMATSWEAYVRRQLRAWPGEGTAFWRRHRHDLLIERWAEQIGAERVVVVVADERDPDFLTRQFAELAGLPAGVLEPPAAKSNRSLTWEEIEAVRAFNCGIDAREAELGDEAPPFVWPPLWRSRAWWWFKIRERNPAHHSVRLPAWAADDLGAHAAEIVDRIRASGVRVFGPVEQLVARPKVTDEPLPQHLDPEVSGQVAARIAETLLRDLGASGTPAAD